MKIVFLNWIGNNIIDIICEIIPTEKWLFDPNPDKNELLGSL